MADTPRGRVRFLETIGGARRLQVRLPLGIIQMEARGRPDGARPLGYESELGRACAAAERPGADGCRLLAEESALYRQRAGAFLTLGEHALAALDATHCVEIAHLVRVREPAEFASQAFGRLLLAGILLRTRALASGALTANNANAALRAVESGLAEIEACESAGEPLDHERVGEVEALRSLREALVPKLPASQRVEISERIAAALRAENYELAAILRNELRQLGS